MIIREDVQEVAVIAGIVIDATIVIEVIRVTTIRVMSPEEIGTVAEVIDVIMIMSRGEEEAVPIILPQKDVPSQFRILIGKILQIVAKEIHSKSNWKHL